MMTARFVASVATAAFLLATGCAPHVSRRAEHGELVFQRQGCLSCHTVGAAGTPLGPDLSDVGARYSPEYLWRWLRDPAAVRPHAHMPLLELSDEDVQALVDYLDTLR